MRYLFAALVLFLIAAAACSPSESLPTTCSPACAAGQVCINAQCLAPVDGGGDARDVAAVDAPAADAAADVIAQDSGTPDAAVDVTIDSGPVADAQAADVAPEASADVVVDVSADVTDAPAADVADVVADVPFDVSCSTGRADCDGDPRNGCEVSLLTDRFNCGGCRVDCPSPFHSQPSCVAGVCTSTCQIGYGDCDGNRANGCETDLNFDASNCQSCGAACSLSHATSGCRGGCIVTGCAANFGDCDHLNPNGCEANLLTDSANCGACGMACAPRYMCVGGRCMADCFPPRFRCGGVCTVPQLNDNCGACGNVCGPHEVCGSTAGVYACRSCGVGEMGVPLTHCGVDAETCVDLNSDQHHCGSCDTDCGSRLCFNGACR